MIQQDIAKALRCCATEPMCNCSECPLYSTCGMGPYDADALMKNAADLIESLVADNQRKDEQIATLTAELEQVKLERDAAVKDCGKFPCQTCEERENGDLCPVCECQGGYRSVHQWRGVTEEGGAEG